VYVSATTLAAAMSPSKAKVRKHSM